MPLNWMCSLMMVGFLLVICFYLYCLKIEMELMVLSVSYNSSEFNWLW